MEADAPNVQDKTAKRANNSQAFAQTKELVAPLTPKRTKITDWCTKNAPRHFCIKNCVIIHNRVFINNLNVGYEHSIFFCQ